MIGHPRSVLETFSAHRFYLNAPKIMPKKRKLMVVLDDMSLSVSPPTLTSTAVMTATATELLPTKRRMSKRLKHFKAEMKDVKVETKKEPQLYQSEGESLYTEVSECLKPSNTENKVAPIVLQGKSPRCDSEEEEMENGVSTYESLRLRNIEENAKFFASLEIFKAKEELSLDGAVKKTASNRGLKREKKHTEVLPRRPRSLRLQRISPEGSVLPPLPVVAPVEEPLRERKPSKPLEMIPENLSKDGNKENLSADFIKAMKSFIYSPKSSAAKLTTDQKAFRRSLSSMTLTPERVAKVTKGRICSVAIHSSKRKVLACAGDKWGRIGLWDVESTDYDNDHGVYLFEPHSRPVNCLHFAPENPDKLYSISYDGTLRCGDLEKGVFDEVYATPDDEDIWASHFDFLSPDGSQLLVSQTFRSSRGYVAVVDTRTRSNAQHTYQVHDKSVKTVSVHPLKKQYFATASTDSTVALWDMRSMKGGRQGKPIVSLPHGRGVTAAYFSPLTGGKLLTTSYDDRLRVFNCTESRDLLKDANITTNIRHNNHTGRWLTPFRGIWHPSREDVFIIGSMNHPRTIDVFDDHGHLVHNFRDKDWLGSVCSINAFHPTRNILVGGNSSGRLHVFM